MTCKTKISGEWKDIKETLVKVGGQWKNIKKTFIKINGEWKNTCGNLNGKIYGVRIDTTNPSPDGALYYIDDAVGMTPAKGNNGNFSYGSWRNEFPFNQIKPCVFKNGVVQYYLNPNDYTKKEDGSNSDITSGNDGDVMIEFPKIYWKFERIGTNLYIRYSDVQIDSGYQCLAHMRGATIKNKIYIASYLGWRDSSNKLRSLSGKTPTSNLIRSRFRTLAQANGANYEQMAYYQLLMLQILYIVAFKSRNSQVALGLGYIKNNSAPTITGGADKRGMFYGDNIGTNQMKFCGIEDFIGNLYYWIDGLYSDSNRNILIGNQNFNDTGSGYTNFGIASTSNIYGYTLDVQGGTNTGFLPKTVGGSSTTYYCDLGSLWSSNIGYFGSYYDRGDEAGVFQLPIGNAIDETSDVASSRIIYL